MPARGRAPCCPRAATRSNLEDVTAMSEEKSLFEAVPALAALPTVLVPGATGVIRLVPAGHMDHPGYVLGPGVNRFGRAPELNDFVVESRFVSTRHCEVTVEGGRLFIQDLGSRNGTFVNRKRVEGMIPVDVGDEIGVSADVRLTVVLDEALSTPVREELEHLDSKSPIVVPDVAVERRLSRAPMRGAGPSAGHAAPARPGHLESRPEPARGSIGDGLPPESLPHTGGQAGSSSAVARGAALDADQSVLLGELERQRNILALLYQVALRCLTAPKDGQAVEQILTNVMQRLVLLQSGFLAYHGNSSLHVSSCPTPVKASEATVRALLQFAQTCDGATVVRVAPGTTLGDLLDEVALVVPLRADGEVRGALAAIAPMGTPVAIDAVEIMEQLGIVAAAALLGL